jgi:hypothetical protein
MGLVSDSICWRRDSPSRYQLQKCHLGIGGLGRTFELRAAGSGQVFSFSKPEALSLSAKRPKSGGVRDLEKPRRHQRAVVSSKGNRNSHASRHSSHRPQYSTKREVKALTFGSTISMSNSRASMCSGCRNQPVHPPLAPSPAIDRSQGRTRHELAIWRQRI